MCGLTLHHLNEHGIKIIESCSNSPLLVGYREGPHLSSKTRKLSLCVGDKWYATWTDPFLKAYVDECQITVKIRDHLLETAPEATVVNAWQGASGKHTWRFTVGIPHPLDHTTTVQEDFEWHTGELYRLAGEKGHRHGSYLVRVSTRMVVATLERRLWRRRSSVVSLGFVITFLGSGRQYGGLWKIIVFAIGLCGQ